MRPANNVARSSLIPRPHRRKENWLGILVYTSTNYSNKSWGIVHYFLWVLAPSAYMLWKVKDNGTNSKLFRPAANFCCCLVWWSQTLAELYGWQLQTQMSTNLWGSLNHSLSRSKILCKIWLIIYLYSNSLHPGSRLLLCASVPSTATSLSIFAPRESVGMCLSRSCSSVFFFVNSWTTGSSKGIKC